MFGGARFNFKEEKNSIDANLSFEFCQYIAPMFKFREISNMLEVGKDNNVVVRDLIESFLLYNKLSEDSEDKTEVIKFDDVFGGVVVESEDEETTSQT